MLSSGVIPVLTIQRLWVTFKSPCTHHLKPASATTRNAYVKVRLETYGNIVLTRFKKFPCIYLYFLVLYFLMNVFRLFSFMAFDMYLQLYCKSGAGAPPQTSMDGLAGARSSCCSAITSALRHLVSIQNNRITSIMAATALI